MHLRSLTAVEANARLERSLRVVVAVQRQPDDEHELQTAPRDRAQHAGDVAQREAPGAAEGTLCLWLLLAAVNELPSTFRVPSKVCRLTQRPNTLL